MGLISWLSGRKKEPRYLPGEKDSLRIPLSVCDRLSKVKDNVDQAVMERTHEITRAAGERRVKMEHLHQALQQLGLARFIPGDQANSQELQP